MNTDAASSGTAYVDHWMATLSEQAWPVRAVLGFCAGGVYAASLAERIAARQGTEPLLLLFDPEVAVPQTLLWQFQKVVGFMAGVITGDEIAEAREVGQRLHDSTSEIGELRDALIKATWDVGEPAFVRAGLAKPLREELLTAFCSFLCYLAAASELDPFPRWKSAVAFSSASPLSGLHAMRSYGAPADLVGREIAVDVEHAKLLASDEVAAAVAEMLSR
jgi:hypothetical protein